MRQPETPHHASAAGVPWDTRKIHPRAERVCLSVCCGARARRARGRTGSRYWPSTASNISSFRRMRVAPSWAIHGLPLFRTSHAATLCSFSYFWCCCSCRFFVRCCFLPCTAEARSALCVASISALNWASTVAVEPAPPLRKRSILEDRPCAAKLATARQCYSSSRSTTAARAVVMLCRAWYQRRRRLRAGERGWQKPATGPLDRRNRKAGRSGIDLTDCPCCFDSEQGQNGVGHCTGEPLSISGDAEPRQRAALHGPLAGRGVPP